MILILTFVLEISAGLLAFGYTMHVTILELILMIRNDQIHILARRTFIKEFIRNDSIKIS